MPSQRLDYALDTHSNPCPVGCRFVSQGPMIDIHIIHMICGVSQTTPWNKLVRKIFHDKMRDRCQIKGWVARNPMICRINMHQWTDKFFIELLKKADVVRIIGHWKGAEPQQTERITETTASLRVISRIKR